MAEHEKIYERLEQDHQTIRSLMQKIAKTSEQDADTRRSLYAQLRSELIAHDRAETEVFYQALEDKNETQLKAYEGETEHDVLEFVLKELDETDPSDAHWTARFQVLHELTDHHLKEEEKEVFPKAKHVLSDSGAERMTEEFNRHKEQHRQQL